MRLIAYGVALALTWSVSAFGQEDDLAPLPAGGTPAKKPPAKTPKAPPKTPAPKTTPKATPTASGDDDLAPLPAGGTPTGPATGPAVAATGSLKLKIPTGLTRAELSVDGKEMGTLPLAEPLKLGTGEHSVLVKRIGYAVFVKKVTIAANKTVELDVRPQAVAAVLSVTSDVDEAQVFIDGRLITTAPMAEQEWPAKTVEVVVRRDGYKDGKQVVTLLAGQDYPISIKLKAGKISTVVASTDRPAETPLTPAVASTQPEDVSVSAAPDNRPLTSRWYFWAGVGVAAVAVTAAAVAGASAAAPPRKLGSTEICGDKCDACMGFTCAFRAPNGASAGAVSF